MYLYRGEDQRFDVGVDTGSLAGDDAATVRRIVGYVVRRPREGR
ncbi:hypothetical protein [Georgenia sp. AZ-5]